ncbi:YbhB/YbcL family Raf kinase inhibitor-like protein [Azospirillum doebereinerae]|uniref:YbhB/YbcL family Raf kinase inhibitor-like protein n=2 Tax=Azospirillum doebereinerae TaxID=92933 RepID=UPI001EE634DD|nr:YbhB/YbcL family Raf kinase inhibitor-like protein [Azospirillum doebereinerae]
MHRLPFSMIAAALTLTAASVDAFELRSADLPADAPIAQPHVANGFGCTGGNRSPELSWSDPPAGTRSFAVTAYDPDAPTGSGWWHWVVFDLPASATGLPAGAGDASGAALPGGAVQSRTDTGTPGYFGPCPPPGDAPHRYVFTVHALKVERLDLPADSSGALVGFSLTANRLGQATITARYGR